MTPATPDRLFLDFQSALAGRYSLERELGRGGMGIVYLARDLRLERVVAIKLLPRERARLPAARDRFLKEARTAARLSHPHIIAIHAVEEAGDFVFFVMAHVDGETLAARVRRDGPLKPHDAARILREVAWALAYAHGQGVIHRDVKPENILLERDSGRALVADFGIARLVETGGPEAELVGTPEYMSPEQAIGRDLDGRADVYSLGVVGYYILVGRLPFTGPTVAAFLTQHASKAPPPLIVQGAPSGLVTAIERCLAKQPAERFVNGEELAGALGSALETRRDLPVAIRAFLSEGGSRARAGMMAPWIVGALIVPGGLVFLLQQVFPGAVPEIFSYGVLGVGALLVGAAVAAPLVLEVRRIRRLLGAGYTREDLVRGLSVEVERRREEQEYLSGPGTRATRFERLMGIKCFAALGLAAISGVAAFFVPYPAIQWVFGVFGLSCATAVATGIAAVTARRRRLDVEGQSRLKFWTGVMGRWLFKIASIGLRRPPIAAATPDRPTETALGLGALELYGALPEVARNRLGDLPDVVRALENRVRQLRGQGRPAELGQALTALETIRIDLLRLQGGVGTLDGLTADLGAARQIGEQVDALLAGTRP